MSEIQKKRQSKTISNNLDIQFCSDVIDGQIADTEVAFDGNSLFWIEGSEIENFTKELTKLVEKYQI